MASPGITSSPTSKMVPCPHYEVLTINTNISPREAGTHTPPMTPVLSTVSGGCCPCSVATMDEGLQQSILTPPRTPRSVTDPNRRPTLVSQTSGSSSDSTSSSGFVFLNSSSCSVLSTCLRNEPSFEKVPTTPAMKPTPFAPKGTFVVLNNSRPFGHGVWSIVYRGFFSRGSSRAADPEVIAVKKPGTKNAIPILRIEAAILSYLSTPVPTPGVIPFYGFDEVTTSLLMPAYPLTLESFVKDAHKFINSEENISLSTLRCPVVKMRQWLFLARKLCQGFCALKAKRVVHGDIKWGNVLLREAAIPLGEHGIWAERGQGGVLYEPIIIDFSSSQVISTDTEPKAVSALTIPFCAPELLERFLDPEGRQAPVPTFTSDLYSVALTLLTAAIGSDPYSVRMATDTTKASWAKCGDPVGFARGDERGLRVGRGGVVDSCLMNCFGKTAKGRADVETVLARVEGCIEKWVQEGKEDNRWGC